MPPATCGRRSNYRTRSETGPSIVFKQASAPQNPCLGLNEGHLHVRAAQVCFGGLSMTSASSLVGSSSFSIPDSLTVVIAQKIGNQRNFSCANQFEEH